MLLALLRVVLCAVLCALLCAVLRAVLLAMLLAVLRAVRSVRLGGSGLLAVRSLLHDLRPVDPAVPLLVQTGEKSRHY